jgi:hypothetical protein
VKKTLILNDFEGKLSETFPFEKLNSYYNKIILISHEKSEQIGSVINIDGQQKKQIILGQIWTRDSYLEINNKNYETLNSTKKFKYILSPLISKLLSNKIDLVDIPFQGGHAVKIQDSLYVSESFLYTEAKQKEKVKENEKFSWPMISIKRYRQELNKYAEDKKKLRNKIGKLLFIPSFSEVPWSYHIDLLLLPWKDNIIFFGNPFILNDYKKLQNSDLKPMFKAIMYYKEILLAKGLVIIDIPVLLPSLDNKIINDQIKNFTKKPSFPFLSFANSLISGKYFIASTFSSLLKTAIYNEAIEQLTKTLDNCELELNLVELPVKIANEGGFIKCLSNELI